uniref:Reverse transcriptase/retrotransposon-derived protein RNase H-like domain-containing protein n=1 Tax=Chenopodium quinoa TaxID=63459 RepID=A0A803N657_CHEQI
MDSFLWNEEAEAAFTALKTTVTSPPVIALPDFSKPFTLETYASRRGIGVVLLQDENPISFLSKALSEKNYQQSLKYLLEHKLGTPFQQKWLSKLAGLDYSVEYKAGAKNKVADALSRRNTGHLSTLLVSESTSELWHQIKQTWDSDPTLQKIILELQQNFDSHRHFSWEQQCLRRKGKLVIGVDEDVRRKILLWLHDSPQGGHSGVEAPY